MLMKRCRFPFKCGALVPALTIALSLGFGGCGNVVRTEFPHTAVGADGQPLSLEAIDGILMDSSLSNEQKREALRDLGIEDEKLITAFLGG